MNVMRTMVIAVAAVKVTGKLAWNALWRLIGCHWCGKKESSASPIFGAYILFVKIENSGGMNRLAG